MAKENKDLKIGKHDPIWNPEKKEAKYGFNIPPCELSRDSKILDGPNPDDSKVNLAAKHGIDIALNLIDIYRENQKQNGDKFVKSNLKLEDNLKQPKTPPE